MATLDRTISADADDGGANASGDWNDDFDTTLLGDPFGEGEHTWLRFPNITIPQGATIDVAYITFQADDSGLFDAGTILSNIYGIDEDDHTAPTSDGTWATDHSTHTSASTVWDFAAQDSGSLQTPSIVSIIQEIVDRAGWSSGNDIGIHVDDDGSSGAGQELAANEHGSLSAASLHVEYSTATTHQATATGSVSVTGTATGKAVRKATVTGSVVVTGTATARAIRKATASGAITVTGTGTAKSQPQKATASGSISITGTATAKAVRKATASGAITITGTATGARIRTATATGLITVTGTATAKVVRKATASGSVVITGTAALRIDEPLTIVAPTAGQFYRLDDRLHIAPLLRGGQRGFRTGETWEKVSDPFIYDGLTGSADIDAAMATASAAWSQHAGSAAATLRSAINDWLDAYGFRARDGSRLT